MARAMEVLTDEDFYRTAHRKIYLGMLDLSEHGEVIDQITLTERLKAKGELESVGGAAYLAELVQAVPTAANIKYHCKIVRDKALLRGLIGTSTEVITRGYDGAAPVDDLLDFAERSVFSLAQGKLVGQLPVAVETINALATRAFDVLVYRYPLTYYDDYISRMMVRIPG